MVCFKAHLERGNGSIIGSPFKVRLARGSVSNMGSPFKVLLVRGGVSNLWFFFSVYFDVVFVVLRLVELVSVRLC